MARSPSGSYSSREPTAKTISVRLTGNLVEAVEEACAQRNLTPSEFLRELIYSWVYGESHLQEPSDGYREARSLATRLAHAAVSTALDNLPDTPEGATQMLGDFYGRRS